MQTTLSIIGYMFLLMCSLLCLLSLIGISKNKVIFNKIHLSSIGEVTALLCCLLGVALITQNAHVIFKLVFILIVFIYSGPLTAYFNFGAILYQKNYTLLKKSKIEEELIEQKIHNLEKTNPLSLLHNTKIYQQLKTRLNKLQAKPINPAKHSGKIEEVDFK